jgi:hypothetical protein
MYADSWIYLDCQFFVPVTFCLGCNVGSSLVGVQSSPGSPVLGTRPGLLGDTEVSHPLSYRFPCSSRMGLCTSRLVVWEPVRGEEGSSDSPWTFVQRGFRFHI